MAKKPLQAPVPLPVSDDVTEIPPTPAAESTLSFAEARRLRRIAAERRLREMEALKLYEPLPKIDQKFHASRKRRRLIRGSNRAGKTLAAAVEVARMVTGQDPYDKFPRRDGRLVAVGFDEKHLGSVMFRKLFRPGAFRIIRDLTTGKWRAYRPRTDRDRLEETKPAPPLIPKRFIAGPIAWAKKATEVPESARFTTGWEIAFFSSKAAPEQGTINDQWWIDEECINESWFTELQARAMDRKGGGFWSATPLVANPQLYDLSVLADEGDPWVDECIALVHDNPHIDEEELRIFEASLSEEEREVRIGGKFRLTGFRIYPEFSMTLHGMDGDGWQVPADWCRYLAIDPGRQICAVLFIAVPPPSRGLTPVVYDELYLKACDAARFGLAMEAKCKGLAFEQFLIDRHASKVTEMGSGKTVESQYRNALKARGVECRATGSGFIWGLDDPKGGIEMVRSFLRLDDRGLPRLKILRGRCPNLEAEFGKYHYKRIKLLVTDEPEKKNDHLMDCLRYLVCSNLRWRKPAPAKKAKSPAVRALEVKRKKQKASRGAASVSLGPRERRA